jgi:hypothetical protein
MSDENFKVGDMVTWSSQSQGAWKQKTGTIVEVIHPMFDPSKQKYPELWTGAGPGRGRKNLSYIVRVGDRHYWPVASKLALLSEVTR